MPGAIAMRIPPAVVSTGMTTTHPLVDRSDENAGARIRRRLGPLYVAAWLLGINFWVPVEKLFLSQIGFTAATIGLLAATYAAVVPFLEIPSGILADRWSRRGVLIVADLALAGSALVGGLSHNVSTYLASAPLLGVYFALQSGTVDSIIYDVLVEETGHSDGFERELGRLRLWEGIALVSSALAGGGLASLTSARVTYFLTVPFAVLSISALSRFPEPQLHRAEQPMPLRGQIATSYRTIINRGRLRHIIATMVPCALLLQMLLEFGPLWLVALAAPAFLYGPQWAGLMSAVGLGGILTGPAVRSPAIAVSTVIAAVLASDLVLSRQRSDRRDHRPGVVGVAAGRCQHSAHPPAARRATVLLARGGFVGRQHRDLAWLPAVGRRVRLAQQALRRTHRRVAAGRHHGSNLRLSAAPRRGAPQPPSTSPSHCPARRLVDLTLALGPTESLLKQRPSSVQISLPVRPVVRSWPVEVVLHRDMQRA